jgi:hypothetical protein
LGEALRLLLVGFFVTILAVPAIGHEGGTPSVAIIQPIEPAAHVPPLETPSERVGRLSLVSGNVNLRTSERWLDAEVNFPLAAGASVRTGSHAQADVEIGVNTIELGSESEIEITKLNDRAVQVAVVRGRIGFALRWLGDGETVEVDISGECVPLLQSGR